MVLVVLAAEVLALVARVLRSSGGVQLGVMSYVHVTGVGVLLE